MNRWLLVVFGVLPLIAFIAEGLLPGSPPVHWLDAWFSLHCHQIPSRTLRVGDHLLPVCARCTGLYGGLLAGAALHRPAGTTRLWVGFMAIAGVFLILDVATQEAGLRVSSLALRLLTGAFVAYPAARLATGG